MSKIKLDDLKWTGNSKKMYDKILEELPLMYRAAVRKKFEVWVNKKNAHTIKEWNIKHTIEKYATPKYQEMLMPIYEEMKTEEDQDD